MRGWYILHVSSRMKTSTSCGWAGILLCRFTPPQTPKCLPSDRRADFAVQAHWGFAVQAHWGFLLRMAGPTNRCQILWLYRQLCLLVLHPDFGASSTEEPHFRLFPRTPKEANRNNRVGRTFCKIESPEPSDAPKTCPGLLNKTWRLTYHNSRKEKNFMRKNARTITKTMQSKLSPEGQKKRANNFHFFQ